MDKGKRESSKQAYWKGFFSVFDLWGTSNNHNHYEYNPDNLSPEELDYQAVKEDWEMVGQDLQYAMNQYDEKK